MKAAQVSVSKDDIIFQFFSAQFQLPPLLAALALSSILLHFQSKANVAAGEKPVGRISGGEH